MIRSNQYSPQLIYNIYFITYINMKNFHIFLLTSWAEQTKVFEYILYPYPLYIQ